MRSVSGKDETNLDTRLLRFVHDPGSEDPTLLARDLVESGQPLPALEVITEGLRGSENDPELLLLAGRAWLLEGDLARSQQAFLKAARVAPQNEETFRWLGEVLLRRGDLSRAKRVVHQSLTLHPDNEPALVLVDRIVAEELRQSAVATIERVQPAEEAPTDMDSWAEIASPDPERVPLDSESTVEVLEEILTAAMAHEYEMTTVYKSSEIVEQAERSIAGDEDEAEEPNSVERVIESKPNQQRSLSWIVAAVAIALVALLSVGYFRYRDYGRLASQSEFAKAHMEIFRGGSNLMRADRRLVRLLEGNNEPTASRLWVFGRAMRVLDEGEVDGQALSDALERTAHDLRPAELASVQSVLAWANGDRDQSREMINAIAKNATDEALPLYVMGRLRQRLQTGDGELWLRRALRADATLVPAALALVEADYFGSTETTGWLKPVLVQSPNHIRAGLWNALFSDPLKPSESVSPIESKTDRILSMLATAREKTTVDERKALLGLAVEACQPDARLCLLVSASALRFGAKNDSADYSDIVVNAHKAAVAASPSDATTRVELAKILLSQDNGGDAIDFMSGVPIDQPMIAELLGRAAILSGNLQAGKLASEFFDGEERASMRSIIWRVRCEHSPDAFTLGRVVSLSKKTPGDLDAKLAVAACALGLNKKKLAASTLQPLLNNPKNTAALHQWGVLQERLGNDDKALEAYARVLQSRPSFGRSLLNKGRLEFKMNAKDDAAKTFATLKQTPGETEGAKNSVLGRLGRAKVLMHGGDVDGASTELDELSADEVNLPDAIELRGRVELARGNSANAVALLKDSVALDGLDADTMTAYADALYASGNPTEALVYYRRAIRRERRHVNALMGYATCLIRAEKYRPAIGVSKRALSLALKDALRSDRVARAQFLVGRAYEAFGRRVPARTYLERSVAQDNPPTAAWFFLGEALSGKNSKQARKAYERYLAIDPNGPYAQRVVRAIK